MMKKFVILLCSIVILISLTGCEEKITEPTQQTQEEFQVEFMEKLSRLTLYATRKDSERIKMFDENNGIYFEEYKLKLHAHDLSGGTKTFPTVDQLYQLYFEYDEGIYNGFLEFYKWYWEDGGRHIWDIYHEGTLQASRHYKMNKDPNRINVEYSEMTAEDFYEFEDYIRQNPDFTITIDDYIQLLEWLGVERPEETSEESSNKG